MGSKLFQVVSKVKVIKHKVEEWNSYFFGNIIEDKITLEEKLESIDLEFMNPSFFKKKKLMKQYEEVLAKE